MLFVVKLSVGIEVEVDMVSRSWWDGSVGGSGGSLVALGRICCRDVLGDGTLNSMHRRCHPLRSQSASSQLTFLERLHPRSQPRYTPSVHLAVPSSL